MRLPTKWMVVLLGSVVFAVVLGSFAPAGAQHGPQFDFTPVAYVYLPLVESGSAPSNNPPSTSAPTTPTITPTSQPGPPVLLAPENGAVLTQPVGLNEWLFHWDARTGPCHSLLSASGPNGYSIDAFIHWEDSSPAPYSYHYTRTISFPADAIGLWTWQVTVICPTGSAQSETRTFYLQGDPPTPTPTLVPISTPTPTPSTTAQPGPPTLLAPANGAVLTQPVSPNEWLFHWNARTGPCHSSLHASGPNGYSIDAFVDWQTSSPGPYSYHYTRTVPFPANAFGAWTWQVMVSCPLGIAQSETRTFYLQGDPPTPTPTLAPISTPTPTPSTTAQPGPPVLLAPENGAVLQQPVDGNGWLFRWQARMGPCHSSFIAHGPNGYAITAQVYYTSSAPGLYSYYYTRTVPFPAEAVGSWTWQATVSCPSGSAQSEIRTFYLQDDTPVPTPTRTPSPTSQPGPPTLLAPANGAVLTQPVSPNEWLFQWNARTGPCHSSFHASGPNGYSIDAFVDWQTSSPGPYSYHYTRTVPFPANAFGAWTWQATVICNFTSIAHSEIRTFYLQGDLPTPTPTRTPTRTPTPTPSCSVDW